MHQAESQFHYGSIKTSEAPSDIIGLVARSQFHYGSIKTGDKPPS
ncbi:Hypothetical protein IALB_1216 [Ignavibacterium album JCM 16511]|uniref:Uncharacterized protein n=1 Tax=Ignavibacterium album (strain DSM 19864 / JCM 16511 / NBRC 101810 / Mat9-16) TaxID=945713 RepID=I0AIX0_IGNAJ|nr:Hypothetical protein IALB_1216 [Ignavibacterium album JCM 16511]